MNSELSNIRSRRRAKSDVDAHMAQARANLRPRKPVGAFEKKEPVGNIEAVALRGNRKVVNW